MRATALRASIAVGICLVAAPSARATPPGVHVDPSSPGGKEYAIPLDQARQDASGGAPSSDGNSGGGGSSSGSHLFGVGVGSPGGGSGSGTGSGGSGSSGSGSGGSRSGSGSGSGGSGAAGAGKSGSGVAATAGRLSALNVAAANPEAGPQAPLMVLGASAGVVLAGVGLGLALRRRRATGPDA